MNRAWIALGSNLNDPLRQVTSGLKALSSIDDSRLAGASGLYRTPPWGQQNQPDFINAVAALDTPLEPRALLGELQRIEREHGRRRDGQRWGPRTLDLDLLLFGEREIAEADLVVPHPHMAERAFVLLPLAELASQLEIPGKGRVDALLQELDTQGCRLVVPGDGAIMEPLPRPNAHEHLEHR